MLTSSGTFGYLKFSPAISSRENPVQDSRYLKFSMQTSTEYSGKLVRVTKMHIQTHPMLYNVCCCICMYFCALTLLILLTWAEQLWCCMRRRVYTKRPVREVAVDIFCQLVLGLQLAVAVVRIATWQTGVEAEIPVGSLRQIPTCSTFAYFNLELGLV